MRYPKLLFLLALFLFAACSGKRQDPILRLSAAEALELGKSYMAQEKFYKAEQHLTHAFEVEPNSRSGREALLMAADALYLDGGLDNFIRCEAKYRDFINRFPTSDQTDYAQFQIGNCLSRRVEKPDRDQKITLKALASYQELLRLYPTSSYVAEARQKIQDVTDLVAEHELVVGAFYLSYGSGVLCNATINRLEFLQKEYPAFSKMDAALFYLGLGFVRCNRPEDADKTFLELRQKYPDSELIQDIEKARKKSLKKSKKRQ
jgi:outer membrane protein assembly factor BamD